MKKRDTDGTAGELAPGLSEAQAWFETGSASRRRFQQSLDLQKSFAAIDSETDRVKVLEFALTLSKP